MKTLYLIDGHAQFFRAYFAIRGGMTSPVTGEPTNMTYGFVGMLLKVLREYKPDYLAVVIDVSGDKESFRSEIYPEYKGHREEAPDDMGPQIDRCLQVLELMGVPVLGQEGVEADDVIATLVTRLKREQPDLAIRIVSKDKDLAQLLNDRVELFDVHTDKSVTAADIFKTEGVQPQHVLDILSLMGDTADNIPGVPGIGPKTAAKLILEHGSVENLLANLDTIKGKRRENLEASRDLIRVSQSLVKLRDDLDVTFDLEQAAGFPARLPGEAMLAAFRELGFNRYQDDLRELVGDSVASPAASPADETAPEGSLFASTSPSETPSQITPTDPGTYTCITTEKSLDALIERIREHKLVAVDTETDALSPMTANLCGVAVSVAPREGFYIPVRSPDCSGHLDETTVLDRLRPVLEDPTICKVGHNLKYDMLILRRHGVNVGVRHQSSGTSHVVPAQAGTQESRPLTAQARDSRLRGNDKEVCGNDKEVCRNDKEVCRNDKQVPDNSSACPLFDTMIASYIVDATRSSHKLDVLALAMLNHTCAPITDILGKGKTQRRFDEAPLDIASPYAAEDADIALRLYHIFKPQIEEMDLWTLFEQVEMPLVQVLAELEYNGIKLDAQELDRQREKLLLRIDALKAEISAEAHHPFSPDSPRQLAAALFNKPDDDPPGLGLKVIKRGKTGPSTDQEVLEKLAADPAVDCKLPTLILEYRQLTKLVNTYLISLKDAINPETGRVHASFNQTVAATGRLSSSDPNLQNIPIRTDIGREIRRAFVAASGNVLITADYSQIELRLLAHLAQDPALIEAFEQDLDIHTAVAAEVFGVSVDDVTAEQRNSAKMVNFGIIYGITPWGLARRLGGDTGVEAASKIISDYKQRFSRIDSFLQECIDHAKSHGYVRTILGRRRSIPQIHSNKPQQRSLGERMAINTVVQGSAADLIKLAMIDVHQRLHAGEGHWKDDVRMLLQIHDELVLETSREQADAVVGFVVERMEAAMQLRVPLKVEAAYSENWIDAK